MVFSLNLKVLKTAVKTRLKYLGIYGLDGVTNQHIEEIELLIGVDNSNLKTTRKPRFFGGPQSRVTSDDDRVVDIEVCPKCQKLKLVYDCPSESCQKKQSATQLSRACTRCIARCINCGCCLDNCDYEELLSFELVCLDCWRQALGCQEREPIMTFMSKTTDVQNQTKSTALIAYRCGVANIKVYLFVVELKKNVPVLVDIRAKIKLRHC
ncbi:hypothetical protein RND71_034068 [Anisodus tanguticus]|uniref:Uncharacterized protein n=1 Tax=Anisodus tanguticus TaxID=243964 RepID=A0AAE1R8W2_9SOLA|nr:hypothetical protein RND71_034068 [Anisodus tanguticus]